MPDRAERTNNMSKYLPKELKAVENIDEAALSVAKIAEHRLRILEKEKSSYWKQFKEGKKQLKEQRKRSRKESLSAFESKLVVRRFEDM